LRFGRFEFILIDKPQLLTPPCCFSNILLTHYLIIPHPAGIIPQREGGEGAHSPVS
jgi:hypothetical protein